MCHPFRILVADDDQKYLDLYSQVLSPDSPFGQIDRGVGSQPPFGQDTDDASRPIFEITRCNQGDDTVNSVKKSLVENRPYAVAFLDIRMPPGPDGIWAAKQIRALDPHIEIVIVTGYSDYPYQDIRHIPPTRKLIYIQKPFHLNEIYHFVHTLSAKWQFEKKSEAALQESDRKYRELVENLPQSIFELNRQDKVIFANRHALTAFGYSKEELGQGMSVSRFFSTEDQHRIQDNLARIRNGEKISGNQYTMLRKDGTRISVIIYNNAIVQDGKVEGIRGVIVDITDHRRGEIELRHLKEKFEDLFHNAPIMYLSLDINGIIIECNNTLLNKLGYTRDEIIGKHMTSLLTEESVAGFKKPEKYQVLKDNWLPKAAKVLMCN
ncbi:MAG: PAS domain S-box protein [Deltaproteobacteria bacterium]|nr:PAS domain S-box protein [Deltaproteobacteria bacterium]